MSSSLLWLNSVLIFFLIASVSAQNLGITPSTLDEELAVSESKCFTYRLVQNTDIVAVSLLWADSLSRNFNDYYLRHIDGVSATYSSTTGSKSMQACFYGKEIGKYHGLFLFESRLSNVVLGSWVNLEVGDMVEQPSTRSITGLSVLAGSQNLLLSLYTSTSMLSLFLLILLLFLVRRKSAY